MADSKITALDNLTSADPANDMIPIVDVSATPPASGNTKRISINNILACSPTATLASATITGDLTVDTSTLKVDSSGNVVGIRTATPTAGYGLTIAGQNGLVLDKGATNQFLAISTRNSTQNYAVYLDQDGVGSNSWSLFDATNSQTAFRYYPGSGGSWIHYINGSTAMTLNSTGLNVANGNVILGTSGKGIDFSATASGSGTMTSELFADYEEGTFTPTVSGSTDAGTGTYSNQNGFYTKVGRLVTVTVYLNWTAHTGTGNLRFSNLPFTAANVAGNYNGISIGFVSNIALTAGNVLYGLVEYGTSYITATQTPTGGGAYSTVPIDTAGEIAFTATYYV